MSEKRSGPVAPGEAVGAQEFFRKRKRAYFRAEKRGEVTEPVFTFLTHYHLDKFRRKMIEDLNRQFFS